MEVLSLKRGSAFFSPGYHESPAGELRDTVHVERYVMEWCGVQESPYRLRVVVDPFFQLMLVYG